MLRLVLWMLLVVSTSATTTTTTGSLEIGVRILFVEGTKRSVGLGNPCDPKEREMIKTAFRQAVMTSGDNETAPLIHRTDRQLGSCSYLCEHYDPKICYLAHAHCAAPRTVDEMVDHQDGDNANYLDKYDDAAVGGLPKFRADHIIYENDIIGNNLASLEHITCRAQKNAIHTMITNWLALHLSPRCHRLVQTKVDLTCFRL